MRKNWPVLTILAILSLAAMACAQPIPTATPDIPATVEARLSQVPTATPYPTATPRPTLTPYPTPTARPTATAYPTATPRPTYTLYPTPTPLPTYTPYPTATAYPTYTPYPTPTPTPRPTATPRPTPTAMPTATPRPTATPTPQWRWVKKNPKPYYSIDVPSDWSEAYSSDDYVAFAAPQDQGTIEVFSTYAEYGWVEGFTAADLAAAHLSTQEDEPGYRLITTYRVSSTVQRSHYQYDGGVYCDIVGFGLHILLAKRNYLVRIEICDFARGTYDDDFVNRVFSGLSYR